MKKQMPVLLLILVLCLCLSAGMAKADVIEMEYWEEFLYSHYEDCEDVNTYYIVNQESGVAMVREDLDHINKIIMTVPNGEKVFIRFIYHDPNGTDWGFWLDDDVMNQYHTDALWIYMPDVYDPENPPEDLVIYERQESSAESSSAESSEAEESSRDESSEEEESSQIHQPGFGGGSTLAIVISAVILVMLISLLILVLIKDR